MENYVEEELILENIDNGLVGIETKVTRISTLDSEKEDVEIIGEIENYQPMDSPKENICTTLSEDR